MKASEAKSGFGQLPHLMRCAPVTVMRNGREVGALFSKPDLEAMGVPFPWPPLPEAVQRADLTFSEALLRQAMPNNRLAEADAAVVARHLPLADESFGDTTGANSARLWRDS